MNLNRYCEIQYQPGLRIIIYTLQFHIQIVDGGHCFVLIEELLYVPQLIQNYARQYMYVSHRATICYLSCCAIMYMYADDNCISEFGN